ncbi:MAG: hypothetical protein WAK20_18735 [Candidatus Acidiferrum sp.]
MSEAKRTLKQRVIHGMREYVIISLYLFVVFSVLAAYNTVILAEHQIDLVSQGLALINALALGKVILVGQELNLANRFRDAPLIYPTLLKSFVYTLLLACFKIVEETALDLYHDKPFGAAFAGGDWKGFLSLSVLLFVVLIPFFGFTELRRVMGDDRLLGGFFRARHLLNLPAKGL